MTPEKDATPAQDDPLMPPETLRERLAADGRMFRLGIEAATPAQGIDRDALVTLLHEEIMRGAKSDRIADRILALVRPVEGIVLSPEERDLNRRIVVRMAGFARAGSVLEFDPVAVGKLADRLEASS